MRSYTLLFVNGRRHLVRGADAFLTLSDFLRKTLKLCGTKIVCSEGDCGSCSVLCGRIGNEGEPIEYLPIDSCIRFVFQLDGCHVITIEGLAETSVDSTTEDSALTGVQKAMVDCHGSQCGFCTPGFVMAMTGILEQSDRPTVDDWRHGLSGNLCRCTGYSPIISAGCQAAESDSIAMNDRYPHAVMADAMTETLKETFQDPESGASEDGILIEWEPDDGEKQTIACPTTIHSATQFLDENRNAKVIAGGTDLGVQFNKGVCRPQQWLDLNQVTELSEVRLEDGCIVASALATWTDVGNFAKLQCPQFYEIVSIFGSPQIRNVGTLAGNIINASPIADSTPFLMVCDAELTLQSVSGSRTVSINEFYHGYKQFDLHPGELLTQIRIPLPSPDQHLRLYKVSRRRDMDISTFTAAIEMTFDGDSITDAKIAYGAVGPIVIRLKKTEEFLQGRPFDLDSMKQAGKIAVDEITPISDVRGSEDFRLRLARNVLSKYFHETTFRETAAAGAIA